MTESIIRAMTDEHDIDWVFDTSREGTIPKGDGFRWRWALKYWVISSILGCLAAISFVVTRFLHPRNVAPELVFAVVMGVMIVIFSIFLVWMTYRRAVRQENERKAEKNLRSAPLCTSARD